VGADGVVALEGPGDGGQHGLGLASGVAAGRADHGPDVADQRLPGRDLQLGGEVVPGHLGEDRPGHGLALVQADPLAEGRLVLGGHRGDGGPELAQVAGPVEHDHDPAAGTGDPGQLTDRSQGLGHVVEHVRGQGEADRVVAQRQHGRIRGGQRDRRPGRRGQPAPGRGQHADRQVSAEHPAAGAPPGQLVQVQAVAAADVEHGVTRGGRGQVEHPGGQVDPRALVRVDRLAGRQVRVGLVLGAAQVTAVRPRAAHPAEPVATSYDHSSLCPDRGGGASPPARSAAER
jgi:hypothetical protein